MKGHVSKRGNTFAYWFDIDPDPLTGKRRQQTKSGFGSEKTAWKECRAAMTEYEKGRLVKASRRQVGEALTKWLTRIEHSIKPSMTQNWRNHAAYYVIPHMGLRAVQDIDGAVCDALYAKLLAEGRVKAQPRRKPTVRPVHARRVTADGRELPCRPYRYDAVRCYRQHAEDDPAIGQQSRPRSQVGARPGTLTKPRRSNLVPVWNPRRSSTPTVCCTGPGRICCLGLGQTQHR